MSKNPGVITPRNCDATVRQAIQQLTAKIISLESSPVFTGLTLSGLAASKLFATDSNKTLISVTSGDGLSYDTDTHILSVDDIYTSESAQDAVGTILVDSSSINFTYTDSTPEITAVVLPGGVDHDSLFNVHQDVNTDATPVFAGLESTGIIDASAGEVLVADNATVEPAGKNDGYIGVAVVGGAARVYFTVGGMMYYVNGTLVAVAEIVTGNPIGLLLSLTYTIP